MTFHVNCLLFSGTIKKKYLKKFLFCFSFNMQNVKEEVLQLYAISFNESTNIRVSDLYLFEFSKHSFILSTSIFLSSY